MKQEIHGNIEGVRRTLLVQMKALYQLEIDGDAFLPPELSQALAVFTTLAFVVGLKLPMSIWPTFL